MRVLTIGIDVRPALSRMTGVGRYVSGVVAALARIDETNRYVLFSSSWRERYRPEGLPPNFEAVDRRFPVRVLNAAWHRLERPALDTLARRRIDIAHSPHPLLLPCRAGCRIVTIHDLHFLRHPEATRAEIRRDYPRLVRAHARRADAVVCVSRATADDVVASLDVEPERIAVVPNGVDPRELAPRDDDGARAARYAPPPAYVLAVATLEPRKNLPVLVEAMGLVRRRGLDAALLLAGGDGADRDRVEETTRRLGLEAAVRRLGYVPPEDLPALYRRARVVVLPSVWEGFGLPLLEAMACGVPVVASDIPAHREVAADAALYFPPPSPELLADALERAFVDEAVRARLVRRGAERVAAFSWDEAARRLVELYARLGAGVR